MKLSSLILLAFSFVLILSIIDTTSNYLLSLDVEENREFVNESQEIIRNSGRLHKSMIEMQSSFRGYLLTSDTAFLTGYNKGLTDIPPILKDQRKLVQNNAEQLSILDSIDVLHNLWMKYANSLIKARKGNLLEEQREGLFKDQFENQLKKQVGKKINDEIESKFSVFDRIEYKRRSVHSNNLLRSIQKTHTFSLIFFVLTIIIGIGSTVYIVIFISKRIKTMVKLAENISKGEFTIVKDTRKDELTSLSNSLNIMSANLSRSINELEKRNAELDKFAYVVSHDLKAPLRGIHNVVNWIEEDMGKELSPELKKYLDIIPQRVKRMEDLINGLLDYARTREKTIPEKIDVKELVNEIVNEIVPRAFEVEIMPMPIVITERLKLEQIFSNLISNAVKYTPGKNAKIIIGCVEKNNFYEFSVKDNGIGIEKEYHEKIFEMFQTLREKNEKESTGIGLAIIKKILDDQHCTITIKSVIGNGSEFIFTWPKINIS